MTIAPEELVSAREAARGFSGLVEKLRAGELAKVVVLHRNRPPVVVVTYERYIALAASHSAGAADA